MIEGILGRKVGMTQRYAEDGSLFSVTVIQAGPCHVMQVKTTEKDGYEAVQLGFDDKKRKIAKKPEAGHARFNTAELGWGAMVGQGTAMPDSTRPSKLDRGTHFVVIRCR